MDAATREFVRQRAGSSCEYCLLRQEHSELTHHIEHIVVDPVNDDVVPLFHPRRD